MAYTPPIGSAANFIFKTFTPPTGDKVNFILGGDGGAAQPVFPAGFDSSAIGTLTAFLKTQTVTAPGFTSYAVGAGANVINKSVTLILAGIDPGFIGGATVINSARQIIVPPIAPIGFGAQLVYNWKQIITVAGLAPPTWTSSNSGTVLNHIQPTTLTGFTSNAYGAATVANKTATRVVAPPGFGLSAYGVPSVSPRTVFAIQFTGSAYGTPNVQSPPHPLGIDSMAFGFPTVLDNHQTAKPLGIDSIAWGLPSTKRLQEFIRPPSVLETTLFGDGRAILRQRYVYPQPVDDGFISPFANAFNRNRQVLPFGFTSHAVLNNAGSVFSYVDAAGVHDGGPATALPKMYLTEKQAAQIRYFKPDVQSYSGNPSLVAYKRLGPNVHVRVVDNSDNSFPPGWDISLPYVPLFASVELEFVATNGELIGTFPLAQYNNGHNLTNYEFTDPGVQLEDGTAWVAQGLGNFAGGSTPNLGMLLVELDTAGMPGASQRRQSNNFPIDTGVNPIADSIVSVGGDIVASSRRSNNNVLLARYHPRTEAGVSATVVWTNQFVDSESIPFSPYDSMRLIRAGEHLYLFNVRGGTTGFTYSIDPTTGVQTQIGTQAPRDVARTANGIFLMLADGSLDQYTDAMVFVKKWPAVLWPDAGGPFDAGRRIFKHAFMDAVGDYITVFTATTLGNENQLGAGSAPNNPIRTNAYLFNPANGHVLRHPYDPQHSFVSNVTPGAAPNGIAAPGFGTPDVGARFRTITLNGFIGAAGTPIVKNAAMTVAPVGFVALLTTPGMVSYRIRSVLAQGFTQAAYGAQTVWFRVRPITGIGGTDMSAFGVTRTDLKDRRVQDAAVQAGSVVPAPTTWFRVRTVNLDTRGIGWLVGKEFGGTTVQDATKRIGSAGAIGAELFGAASARRNEVIVSPDGLTGDIGAAFVDLAIRYIGARSFLNEEIFGPAVIFNSRQYVAPFTDPDSALLMGGVGVPWGVENRNHTVGTFGFDMSILSNHADVELGGRDIHPVGSPLGDFGPAVVSMRVRYVQPQGWEEFFARFSTVHNASAVLEPSGIPRGQVGVPSIKDTRQFMDAVGGNQFVAFGDAFTSYFIRTVVVTFPPGAINLPVPDASLYTRYLTPTPIEGGCGVPFVESHRNLVNPKGYPMDLYGDSTVVANVTPEVKVYPTLLTEYGRPNVYNRNSYVAPSGFSTIWGSTLVDYRVKTVKPGGFEALRISSLNFVQFDAPQLPAQTIVNLDIITGGAGGGINESSFGPIKLLLRGMNVPGFEALAMGKPTVISYGIGPVTIPFDANDQFGIPTLNPTLYVAPVTIEFKTVNPTRFDGDTGMGDGASWLGTPRITPYTISLSVALNDHNEVDFDPGVPHHPWWGNTVITQRNRTIAPAWNPSPPFERFGQPDVQLRRRYVQPVGFKSFKYGVPTIPSNWYVYPFWGRTTEAEVPGVNIDTAGYGTAAVFIPVPPGPFIVKPVGFSTIWGNTQVDLFNRTITGAGAIYGTIFSGNNWVHPPIKIFPTGFDSSAIGNLATGLKYRYILVDSTDLDTHWGIEYNGGIFPMRVRLAQKRVTIPGIPAGNIGVQYVGLRQQGAAVAGGPIGVVPAPVVRSNAQIAPGGWDSLQMGIPKQPIYGVIEPYGDDMALYGRPGLNLGVHAPYIEPGFPGHPNVQRGIAVAGLEGVFGDTVVIGESNCGSTLAVIPMLGDTSKFGQPGVHR